MKPGKKLSALLLSLLLTSFLWTAAVAVEEPTAPLSVKDGMLQPVFTFTDPLYMDYTNKGSDLLRFSVWVETDYDTDGDDLKCDIVVDTKKRTRKRNKHKRTTRHTTCATCTHG